MQEHHYPENESIRIDTLRSLNILDTLSEQRFACLTKLAKRLFAVPIALVSLIDVNRQWFKSCIGMEIKETAENISFCGHTILENEILMIPDTTLDERFYDNPLVIDEPKIRFYAGVPLAVANGSNVGTLCLIDSQPRTLTDEEKELLWDLGHLA
ncbi:MAG: GAF domain-containing protein, partial [Pseudanabaena sp.]